MSQAALPATHAVVIPNWNGALFIERCLGSVYAALRAAGMHDVPVIVYDDVSEDDSVPRIQNSFPQVKLLVGQINVGFGAASNAGIKAAEKADWIFLLNNDLALPTDFFNRLLAALDSISNSADSIFSIGAQTLDWETHEPNHGGQRAVFKNGLLQQDSFPAEALAPADFFQAGACLMHRAKFHALGGFSSVFHPGYWEDYDLAWAAQRRGWKVYYEPRAAAFHCGKGSMRKRYGDFQVSLFLRRNHLIFNWTNLPLGQLARHLFSLPALIVSDSLTAVQAGWGRALLASLARLPGIIRLRRSRHKDAKATGV